MQFLTLYDTILSNYLFHYEIQNDVPLRNLNVLGYY